MPIGDEDDFSGRGVRTLQSADMIVAPDEKEAARLLKRFSIAKRLSGIEEELSDELADEVMERLHKGERVVVLNSGAGYLAEPVRRLANIIRDAGLEPRVIPGVDSVTMALLMSGFPADRYFMAGTIPTRREPREEFIRSLAERPETAVVVASAPRLTSTLAGLAMKMPRRRGAVVLKPTIPGEIVLRGLLADLRERLASKMLTGTAMIVLAPVGLEYEYYEETEEDREIAPVEGEPDVAPEETEPETAEHETAQGEAAPSELSMPVEDPTTLPPAAGQASLEEENSEEERETTEAIPSEASMPVEDPTTDSPAAGQASLEEERNEEEPGAQADDTPEAPPTPNADDTFTQHTH